ncbi:alpha/beta fold hydrolase, partial [Candidatus Phytoplasma melaleucae]
QVYAHPLLNKEETGLYTDFKEVTLNNAKANVIVTHGIGESSREYERLANYLKGFNYNVLLYDIRNHGQSISDYQNIGDIDSFHTFIDDLHLIVTFLKRKNNLKVFLLGHSLGGIVNNCYVYKYDDIDGVINSGSPTKIIEQATIFADETNIQNMPNVTIGQNYERLSRIPLGEEMKEYRIFSVTPRFLRNIMCLSIDYFQENLINNSFCYPKPILLLHGQKDSVILYENSQEMFNIIQTPDKDLKLYPESFHNLFNDLDYQEVQQDVLEWLENKILS